MSALAYIGFGGLGSGAAGAGGAGAAAGAGAGADAGVAIGIASAGLVAILWALWCLAKAGAAASGMIRPMAVSISSLRELVMIWIL